MAEYKPTEYVVDFGDYRSNQFVFLNMALIEQNGAKLHERIVRCRDCKFSRIHDGNSWPGNKHKEYVGKTYCIAWGDGMQGEWTDPNGHCHKAKRKECGDER